MFKIHFKISGKMALLLLFLFLAYITNLILKPRHKVLGPLVVNVIVIKTAILNEADVCLGKST